MNTDSLISIPELVLPPTAVIAYFWALCLALGLCFNW